VSVGAVLLTARALLRAWRRHPLRALAALAGIVLGTALVALVVTLDGAISSSARSASGVEIVRADFAVHARSTGGMSVGFAASLRERGQAVAPGTRVTPVLQVSSGLTGVSGRGGDVLSVLGVARNVERFLPPGLDRGLIEASDSSRVPGLLVGSAWLERHGYRVGDRIQLATPDGALPWRVVGAIPGDLPNDGAIAAGDIGSVAEAFGRRRRVDTLYVQTPVETRDAVATGMRAAAGDVATVGALDLVGGAGARPLAIVQAMLLVAGLIGLLSGGIVVFVCWRLLLEDERASIARFRLTGATPLQLAGGAGLVLLAATVACCAIGIPIGIAGERLLRGFSAQIAGFTGLAAIPTPTDLVRPVVAGACGALGIALVAWLAALRSFLRIPVIEAVRPPDPPPPSRTRYVGLAAGIAALALAALLLVALPVQLATPTVVMALVGALLLGSALPSVLGRLLTASSRGFAPLAAGRHLAADTRRSTAVVLMVGLGIGAGLLLSGVAASYQEAIDRSVRSWTQADLFVRLGRPGETLRDARFSPTVRRELARLPGIAEAGAITFANFDYRDRSVMLQAYDTRHVDGIADLIVYEGPSGHALWAALDRGEVAISQSVARLDSVGVGDVMAIPGAAGVRRLPVAAVVDDYVSDGGTIVSSLQTFGRITHDRRIDAIPVVLEAGASPQAVSREIRRALPRHGSLTILERSEFRATISAFVSNVMTVFRGLAVVTFLVVLLAASFTIAASLGTRQRSLGVTQACGATPRDLVFQLSIEAGTLAAAAWTIAALVSTVLVPGTLRMMAAQTGLLPSVVLPLSEMAVALPLGIVAVLLASRVVSQRIVRRDVVDALRFE
jgi:putative ABC transport system permease protein